MKRREATIALVALGVVPFAAEAQPARKLYRIGFLGLSSASDYVPALKAFLQGLHDLGYDEGKNIMIEYRSARDARERLPALASQLVQLNPDVLVSHATGIGAARGRPRSFPLLWVLAPTRWGSATSRVFRGPVATRPVLPPKLSILRRSA